MSVTSQEPRSEITPTGQLRRSLEEREVAAPGPDEVVVRVRRRLLGRSGRRALLSSDMVRHRLRRLETAAGRRLRTSRDIADLCLALAAQRLS
jgi:hypothetical protein